MLLKNINHKGRFLFTLCKIVDLFGPLMNVLGLKGKICNLGSSVSEPNYPLLTRAEYAAVCYSAVRYARSVRDTAWMASSAQVRRARVQLRCGRSSVARLLNDSLYRRVDLLVMSEHYQLHLQSPTAHFVIFIFTTSTQHSFRRIGL